MGDQMGSLNIFGASKSDRWSSFSHVKQKLFLGYTVYYLCFPTHPYIPTRSTWIFWAVTTGTLYLFSMTTLITKAQHKRT